MIFQLFEWLFLQLLQASFEDLLFEVAMGDLHDHEEIVFGDVLLDVFLQEEQDWVDL